MKIYVLLFTSLAILVAAIGCGREMAYRTALADNERIHEKATVLVDGVASGFVKALRIERANRVAQLILTDKAAEKKLKAGVVRILSEDGRIHLRSANVQSSSPPPSTSALIPAQSAAEYNLNQYVTKQTVVIGGIALAIILVLCLLLRSLLRIGLLVVCLALSGLAAWVLHPHLIPYVEQLYAAAPVVDQSRNSGASAADAPSASMQAWETGLARALEHKPPVRIAAFAIILALAFIPFAILLGGAVRSLCRKN